MPTLIPLLSLSFAFLAILGRHPTFFATPAHGCAEWTEVTSAHFLLTTELGRSAAVELSNELETTLEALAAVVFGATELAAARIPRGHQVRRRAN